MKKRFASYTDAWQVFTEQDVTVMSTVNFYAELSNY